MQAKRVSRQVRRLQGRMYEAVRKRVERGLSVSREKNNDFFRTPTRFTTRNIPQYPTMRRKDSDKPLPPIKCLRARRPVAAFLRVVARHGAAVARHGRPPSPAPQHRLLGFRRPRITQHVFLLPSGDSKKSNSKPGLQGFHESRITRHESRPFFESRLVIRLDALPTSLHFSLPRGEAKCVIGRQDKARAAWRARRSG